MQGLIDVSSYQRNGYLLVRKLFSAEEVQWVRQQAKKIFILQMLRHKILSATEPTEAQFEQGMFKLFEVDLPTFINCGKQAQHLVSLHRLSLDPRVIDVLDKLGLKMPNISTRPLLYFNSRYLAKREVYWRLSLHQDWRSMQGSLDAVVVWVALADIDKSLGALEVIPGSHCRGLLPANMGDGYGHISNSRDLSAVTPVEVEAGDALFFSAFLVHQSGTNSTQSIRWSCHFRYNNIEEETFIERGFPHSYVYYPREELITKGFPNPAQLASLFISDSHDNIED